MAAAGGATGPRGTRGSLLVDGPPSISQTYLTWNPFSWSRYRVGVLWDALWGTLSDPFVLQWLVLTPPTQALQEAPSPRPPHERPPPRPFPSPANTHSRRLRPASQHTRPRLIPACSPRPHQPLLAPPTSVVLPHLGEQPSPGPASALAPLPAPCPPQERIPPRRGVQMLP